MTSYKIEIETKTAIMAVATSTNGTPLTSERIQASWFDFLTLIEGNLKVKGSATLAAKLDAVTVALDKRGAIAVRFSCSDWNESVTMTPDEIYAIVRFAKNRAIVKSDDDMPTGKRLKEVEL